MPAEQAHRFAAVVGNGDCIGPNKFALVRFGLAFQKLGVGGDFDVAGDGAIHGIGLAQPGFCRHPQAWHFGWVLPELKIRNNVMAVTPGVLLCVSQHLKNL